MNKDMSNEEYIDFLNIINTLPKKEYEIIRKGVLQLNDDKKELFKEITRLNSIIEEQNEDIYHLLNIIERYKNDIKITSDEELAIFASQNRLEELKKEGK